jgi:hypothetical protein
MQCVHFISLAFSIYLWSAGAGGSGKYEPITEQPGWRVWGWCGVNKKCEFSVATVRIDERA